MIRDTNIPSNIDEFLDKFASYVVVFLLDFFLGYNQVLLDLKSRDITTI